MARRYLLQFANTYATYSFVDTVHGRNVTLGSIQAIDGPTQAQYDALGIQQVSVIESGGGMARQWQFWYVVPEQFLLDFVCQQLNWYVAPVMNTSNGVAAIPLARWRTPPPGVAKAIGAGGIDTKWMSYGAGAVLGQSTGWTVPAGTYAFAGRSFSQIADDTSGPVTSVWTGDSSQWYYPVDYEVETPPITANPAAPVPVIPPGTTTPTTTDLAPLLVKLSDQINVVAGNVENLRLGLEELGMRQIDVRPWLNELYAATSVVNSSVAEVGNFVVENTQTKQQRITENGLVAIAAGFMTRK